MESARNDTNMKLEARIISAKEPNPGRVDKVEAQESKELKKRLRELETKNSDLQIMLEKSDTKCIDLQRNLQEFQATNSDLQKVLEKSNTKYADSQKHLQEVDTKNSELTKQLQETKAENMNLTQWKEKSNELEQKIEETQTSHDSKMAELNTQHKTQAEKLSKNLQNARKKIALQSKQLESQKLEIQ